MIERSVFSIPISEDELFVGINNRDNHYYIQIGNTRVDGNILLKVSDLAAEWIKK